MPLFSPCLPRRCDVMCYPSHVACMQGSLRGGSGGSLSLRASSTSFNGQPLAGGGTGTGTGRSGRNSVSSYDGDEYDDLNDGVSCTIM